ncbi:MAG: hypothetical protein ACLUN9_20955 [Enterocloster aldenensis]
MSWKEKYADKIYTAAQVVAMLIRGKDHLWGLGQRAARIGGSAGKPGG